jgi:hypothetical protein
MKSRAQLALLVLLLFISVVIANAKKKPAVPTYVLKAHTVYVIIDPDTGTSLNDPLGNKTAQDDVEKALMKWGRLSPVVDPGSADLVIVIRKGSGKIVQRTIGGQPTNDRPVIVQQTDSHIRIGGQQGRAPGGPPQTEPQDTRPVQQTEITADTQDTFTVYEGGAGTAENIHSRPIAWRYEGKDALHSPSVPAVSEFRKAIEDAEKQQQQKKP